MSDHTIASPFGDIAVSITRDQSLFAHTLQLVARCRFAAEPDAEPFVTRRAVALTGVAEGSVSLKDSFWRRWYQRPPPYDITNPAVPAELTVGAVIEQNGQKWTGGAGAPSIPAVIGEWYADLSTGNIYKAVRGELAKFVADAAAEFASMHAALAQVDELGIPHEPQPEESANAAN